MSTNPSRTYIANAAAQAAARALSMAGSLASIVMIARVLGVTSFGQVAYITTFVMLAGALADLGTNVALARGLAHEREHDPALYFGNFLLLRAALAVVATGLALLLGWLLRPDILLPLAIGCFAVPFVGARFFESVYQIFGRPMYTVYASLLLTVVQLSAASAVLILKGSVVMYMIGFALSQLVFFAFALYLAWGLNRPSFRLERASVRAILSMAAPMGLWSLFNAIGTRSDVFIIGHQLSLQDVGIYNAAYRFLDIGTTLAATAIMPLVPLLTTRFREAPETLPEVAGNLLLVAALFALPVPLLAPYLAPPLVDLIYGAPYARAAPLLVLFAWILTLLGATYVASALNVAVGHVRYQSWSAALCATVNIALNLLLVPRHGVMGAAWAGLASGVIMAAISLWFAASHIGITLNSGRWSRLPIAALGLVATPVALRGAGVVLQVIPALAIFLGLVWVLRIFPLEFLPRRPASSADDAPPEGASQG